MSAAWPGGKGTMMRTGFCGQAAWARVVPLAMTSGVARASVAARRRVIGSIVLFPPVSFVRRVA